MNPSEEEEDHDSQRIKKKVDGLKNQVTGNQRTKTLMKDEGKKIDDENGIQENRQKNNKNNLQQKQNEDALKVDQTPYQRQGSEFIFNRSLSTVERDKEEAIEWIKRNLDSELRTKYIQKLGIQMKKKFSFLSPQLVEDKEDEKLLAMRES